MPQDTDTVPAEMRSDDPAEYYRKFFNEMRAPDGEVRQGQPATGLGNGPERADSAVSLAPGHIARQRAARLTRHDAPTPPSPSPAGYIY